MICSIKLDFNHGLTSGWLEDEDFTESVGEEIVMEIPQDKTIKSIYVIYKLYGDNGIAK